MKKIIALMLVLALSLSIIVLTASCKDEKPSNETPGGVENPGGDFGGDGNDNTDGSGDGINGGWLPIV
jgi:hypothetical protein